MALISSQGIGSRVSLRSRKPSGETTTVGASLERRKRMSERNASEVASRNAAVPSTKAPNTALWPITAMPKKIAPTATASSSNQKKPVSFSLPGRSLKETALAGFFVLRAMCPQ